MCRRQGVLSVPALHPSREHGEQDESVDDDPGWYPWPGGHDATDQGAQDCESWADENLSEVHWEQDAST